MVGDVVDRISDGQRDCLRLVIRNMTSKDIARELGISPHTVDMRLRKAMVVLGVASRMAAAKAIFDVEEADTKYQRLIYQPQDLSSPEKRFNTYFVEDDSPSDTPLADQARGDRDGVQGDTSGEEGKSLDVDDPKLSLAKMNSHINELPTGTRLVWIAVLTIRGLSP